MRVLVSASFIDIHTGKLHRVGEELTISKARYAEIRRVGEFVRPLSDRKHEQDKEDATNGHENSGSDSGQRV